MVVLEDLSVGFEGDRPGLSFSACFQVGCGSTGVFFTRNRFQVVRVDTGWEVAQVVEDTVGGETVSAFDKQVDDSVCSSVREVDTEGAVPG